MNTTPSESDSNAILDRLRQVGALGDLPESSQVSFF